VGRKGGGSKTKKGSCGGKGEKKSLEKGVKHLEKSYAVPGRENIMKGVCPEKRVRSRKKKGMSVWGHSFLRKEGKGASEIG